MRDAFKARYSIIDITVVSTATLAFYTGDWWWWLAWGPLLIISAVGDYIFWEMHHD